MARSISILVDVGNSPNKNPLNVACLVDLSCSMGGETITQVQESVFHLLRELVAVDVEFAQDLSRISLTTFATEVFRLTPWLSQGDHAFFRDFLFSIPAEKVLSTGGATHLYDALTATLNTFRTAPPTNDNVIVLFSDGCNWEHEEGEAKTKCNELWQLLDSWEGCPRPHVFCVHYGGNPQDRGAQFMLELARRTDGQYEEAARAESIPQALMAMLLRHWEGDSSSITWRLRARLEDLGRLQAKYAVEQKLPGATLEPNWFRTIAICTSENEESYYKTSTRGITAWDIFPSEEVGLSQTEAIDQVLLPAVASLQSNPLESDTANILNVFVVVSGRSSRAKSVASDVRDLIDKYKENAHVPAQDLVNTTCFVLTDNFIQYEAGQKRNLNQLIDYLEGANYKTFVIGDRNDNYRDRAQNQGCFPNLTADENAVLVAECLVHLNLDTSILANADQLLVREGGGLMSISALTLQRDLGHIEARLIRRLWCDYLEAYMNRDLQMTDEIVDRALDSLGTQLDLRNTISVLTSEGEIAGALYAKLDSPSKKSFCSFSPHRQYLVPVWDALHRKKGDKSWNVDYYGGADWIEHVLLDCREYVTACHNVGAFNQAVDNNFNRLLAVRSNDIRTFTDEMLSGNETDVRTSLPRARRWIASCTEMIQAKASDLADYVADLGLDEGEYANFSYVGEGLDDRSAQVHFDSARATLEHSPLPDAIRIRVLPTSLMIFAGASAGLLTGEWLLGIVLLLIAATFVLVAELRIRMVANEIERQVLQYVLAHRSEARERARTHLREKYNELLEKLELVLNDTSGQGNKPDAEIWESDETSQLDALERSLQGFCRQIERQGYRPKEPIVGTFLNRLFESQSEVMFPHQAAALRDIRVPDFPVSQSDSVHIQILATTFQASLPIPARVTCMYVPDGLRDLPDKAWKIQTRTDKVNDITELWLIAPLSELEANDLRSLYLGDWSKAIDRLVSQYGREEDTRYNNPWSLWRRIALYETWLSVLSRQLSSETTGNVDFRRQPLYDMWRKHYQAKNTWISKTQEKIENAIMQTLASVRSSGIIESFIAGSQNAINQQLVALTMPPVTLDSQHGAPYVKRICLLHSDAEKPGWEAVPVIRDWCPDEISLISITAFERSREMRLRGLTA